jgi:hypothetical protein
MSNLDGPVRHHAHQHDHIVSRGEEFPPVVIVRRHEHSHPHLPVDLALHDELGPDRHQHEHLPGHPYGVLVRRKPAVDDKPAVEEILGATKAAAADRVATERNEYQRLAETIEDTDLRKGYADLAAQREGMLTTLAEPDRPRSRVGDALVKAIRADPRAAVELRKALGIDRQSHLREEIEAIGDVVAKVRTLPGSRMRRQTETDRLAAERDRLLGLAKSIEDPDLRVGYAQLAAERTEALTAKLAGSTGGPVTRRT